MQEFMIDGRSFRNQASYEAGLRDRTRIQKIEERAENMSAEERKQLLVRLKRNDFRFETALGEDYVDSFQARMEELENKNTSGKVKGVKKNSIKKEKAFADEKNKKEKKSSQKEIKKLSEYDKDMQKIILLEMRRNDRKRKLIMLCACILSVCCFGFFGIRVYVDRKNERLQENLITQKEENTTKSSVNRTANIHLSEEEEITVTVLPEYEELLGKNQNLIGWIKIDDTNIDYPVMKTTDRSYYLTHGFDDEYDRNGCIFMDPDCDVINRSTNLILYGHHMHSGKMFGTLDQYKKYSYYEEHPIIQFDTIYEKGTYEVVYVFLSKVFYEDEITFKYYQFIDAVSEEQFYSNCEEMEKMSIYDTGVTVSYGDQLLTLSTCDKTEEQGRFVVVARRID